VKRCRCSFLLLTMMLFAWPATAQGPALGDSDAEQAAKVLRELVRIESALLADAEIELAAVLDELKRAADRLSQSSSTLMKALDALALARTGAADVDPARTALTEAETSLAISQRDVEALSADSRAVARRLSDHVARFGGLEQRLATLERQAPRTHGVLAGVWDIAIGPNGDSGTLVIRQFGTLVSGQYQLASGRVGSMRGTFVKSTLRLEVIDARFGRDATFNGVYRPDNALSGTWEAIRLGTGRPAFGDWRASRRVEAEEGPE